MEQQEKELSPKEMARKIYDRYKSFNMDKNYHDEWVVKSDYVTKQLSLAYINGCRESSTTDDDYKYWVATYNELIAI
jgi:hypothetical protein